MADKTSLLISSKDSANSTIQKTITNVNPAATDSQCKSFAKALNNLSTRTLGAVAKVDRTDLTDEVAKKDPCLALTQNSIDVKLLNGVGTVVIGLDYLGEERNVSVNGEAPVFTEFTTEGYKVSIKFKLEAYEPGANIDMSELVFTLPATDEYEEATATVTLQNVMEAELRDVVNGVIYE